MNSDNSVTANLMATRGNRCTAAILGYLESSVYPRVNVPSDLQRQIRQVVLDQINGFKDLAIDVVKSETALMNEMWVEKLDEIHKDIRALRRVG